MKNVRIYHRIQKTQLFDPIRLIYNKDHPSILANNACHFILCIGCTIIVTAHIEFLNETNAPLKSIVTDAKFQYQG